MSISENSVEILFQLVLGGMAMGMVYAVIALGYQLTYATSRTLNFGQGEVLAIGALIGLSVAGRMPYGLSLLAAGVAGFGVGLIIERLAVRPSLKSGSQFGWIMSTIALGIVLKSLAELVWGKDDLRFPSPVGDQPFELGALRVLPAELLVLVGALVIIAAVEYLLTKTIAGKAMDATSLDREAASLVGINPKSMVMLSYGLSSAAVAIAGVLVAPLTLTGASMGTVLGLKAFEVAIIGGLSSARGAVLGGAILGLSEALTAFYISTGYRDVPGLLLLLVVLAIRPNGLLGRVGIVKV